MSDESDPMNTDAKSKNESPDDIKKQSLGSVEVGRSMVGTFSRFPPTPANPLRFGVASLTHATVKVKEYAWREPRRIEATLRIGGL